MTIAEYIDRWLSFRKGDLAANTHARYRTLARNQVVPYIGSIPIFDLSPHRLERLYEELAVNGGVNGDPLRTATIGQVHRFLHVCLERATIDGILENNPVDRVKSPKIAPRRTVMGRLPEESA